MYLSMESAKEVFFSPAKCPFGFTIWQRNVLLSSWSAETAIHSRCHDQELQSSHTTYTIACTSLVTIMECKAARRATGL